MLINIHTYKQYCHKLYLLCLSHPHIQLKPLYHLTEQTSVVSLPFHLMEADIRFYMTGVRFITLLKLP